MQDRSETHFCEASFISQTDAEVYRSSVRFLPAACGRGLPSAVDRLGGAT